MDTTLRLPAELTIYSVGELRPLWLRWLDDTAAAGTEVEVDGSAVDLADAAGVQLLLALANSLLQREHKLQLCRASAPLLAACSALGVAGALGASA